MKYTSLLQTLTLVILINTTSTLFAQNCTVDEASLKGTYTGDCKKGKANGKGKAVGENTYEGEFKSGLPDGDGTYTWSNGNSYNGSFDKGLKNGHGVMTYKRAGKVDSVIEGYWKKGVYIGRYEYPYKVITKTKKVSRVEIKPATAALKNQITIWVSSTSASAATLNGMLPKAEISNLILQTGTYVRSTQNNTYASKSENVLYEVTFPIRMRIDTSNGESVELVINEEGSYVIDIEVNQ